WESGEAAPTLRQLEDFAKATYVPVGYFFLSEPPVEEIPIPDLRTIDNKGVVRPSANLLDTIYICQRRQDWYREYAISIGEEPLSFIGSANINRPVVETAIKIRRDLNLDTDKWRNNPNWEASLRTFIAQVEDVGIMVMVNGVVGNNTHRRLEPREFRGFALCDDFAPLVFINNTDAKAAQMFTLAHELVHLWHGESALSDASPTPISSRHIEQWCNSVAAELLLPLEELEQILPPGNPLDAVSNIRRRFKVSSPVILRRLYDASLLSDEEFEQAYEQEQQQWQSQQGNGGNFYPTLMTRVGRRFAQAVVRDALAGETLYRDACGLLGIRKMATFNELRERLRE
ncbi:MAG: ImmA/IrrE family metallo-endopeptidase, partial [Chloroflexota bacterium]|nr:ImmA/IrrE family metallo-endopeptidase [Chloroflexota bacterium]